MFEKKRRVRIIRECGHQAVEHWLYYNMEELLPYIWIYRRAYWIVWWCWYIHIMIYIFISRWRTNINLNPHSVVEFFSCIHILEFWNLKSQSILTWLSHFLKIIFIWHLLQCFNSDFLLIDKQVSTRKFSMSRVWRIFLTWLHTSAQFFILDSPIL